MADARWVEAFPWALVSYLRMEESDHCPILLQTNLEEKKANRPFRFLHAWTSNAFSKQVVYDAWE